jgi:asparagine synthase (glutamine-hydrolysing)
MCGLTGFFGRFPVERIYAMNALVAHRGPDDEGYWVDQAAGVALGHRRLSIIDLRPEGRQPMMNEDGTIQIVYNGEIYNYRALRAELEAKGHRFSSRTDTETIVHLYEEEGIDVMRRLNGIFAFALWDARRRRLLLARDHLGVKPLYWSEVPEGIVFASELKALLPFPEIPRRLDPVAVHQHLSYIWAASPHTMFEGVKKLEPGYRLVVEEGRVRRHDSYYDLPYHGTRQNGSRADREQQVRYRLAQAIERQMMSDVPLGAFLSGGVDSTAIVALMRRVSGERIRCYTIDFGEEQADENPHDLPWARLVATHLDVDLQQIRVKPDVVDFTERMVYMLDEPQADPACINVHLICEQARADGYKVLLSGAGGDDIFAGYRRHVALSLERYWAWLPHAVRRAIARRARTMHIPSRLSRRTQKYLFYADRPSDERLMSYFLWTPDDVLQDLFCGDLRAALSGYDPLEPLRRSLERIPGEPNALNRMLYLEGKHFLADHNLNYTDKMSMAHGIEVRVPLLDVDLVDYVAGLPASDKLDGTRSKAIFKDAIRPYLPTALAGVLTRPKTGFGAPLRRWIRADLREMVRDVLSEKRLAARGLFDPPSVQRLIVQNERYEVDASYVIFGLMCIEMWMRNFIDAPSHLRPERVTRITGGRKER